MKWKIAGLAGAMLLSLGIPAQAVSTPPNILMIMPDDVGYFNIGAYSHGMMVPTPNIDSIAAQGMLFTDHYAQPTCTPGRAAFITGQLPIRTGLTTVGLPGSPIGLSGLDPTLAEVLKGQGYTTGQFGKNHLGDRNEHLPTVHGFDVFYGNLYHLNSEEEPEDPDWPKDPAFTARYGPRGVLDCKATAEVNPEPDDPRFGAWGKQQCADTGPLTAQRMETIDGDFTGRTIAFMRQAVAEKKPFFAWYAPSRMHIYTHLKPESRYLAQPYSSEYDIYGSGLMEHDGYVGQLLRALDEIKAADNTIVLYTTDNGAMAAWWPDGGTTPFRSEKATTWEGGVRVPMLIRWPGHIKPGSVSNGIQDHTDLFTTLAAAAGVDDVAAKLLASHNVKIDGVNNIATWTQGAPSKRNIELFYNESQLTAIRLGPWKTHFQERNGFFDYFRGSALVFNLRMDPFEQRDGHYSALLAMKKAFLGGMIADVLNAHFASLKAFPPRQKGGSLNPGQSMQP
ncbi:MAG: arylsulfatase [Aestuariivirga sp.]|uniref:arylsulfatase n=1 Tax=Aestuariivirga sp. TaxID=2650926 RepID=UPI0025C49CD9|nr:arylsulfatase [Aestuariivirga sp.]MCA3561278.1 arylsulfatase [Aestuariivirga sp.]